MVTGNGSPRPRNVSKYQTNDMPSSYQQSAPSTSGVNKYPTYHSSAERKRQHHHSRKVTPYPKGPQEQKSPSQPGAAIGNIVPMVAAVTPSPKSESNAYGRTSGTDAMPTIDDAINDDNGPWRKHGKLFRASIVLTDESNGSNSFALSDSCPIERYYRVADRVLEQFISGSIAVRNELIESYLVGNRLFKFLSVVLPTHRQYFSREPKLEALRYHSESQLMELLDYIEEIEMLIDKEEYHRYILNDITPSEVYPTTGEYETSHITNEMSFDDGDANGEFLEGSSNSKKHDNGNNNDTIMVAKSKIRMQTNQQEPLHPKRQLRSGAEQYSSQNNNPYRKFQGGNVKVAIQAIEASHQKQTDDLQSQDEIFKERVAAVLTANNNAEVSNNSGRSIRLVSSGATKSNSLFSRNTNTKRPDSLPEMSHVDAHRKLQEFPSYDAEFIDDQGLFRDSKSKSNHSEMPKKPIEEKRLEEEKRIQHEPAGKSLMSWDADFSHFNEFSLDTQDFEGFKQKKTNIDLLLEDPPSPKQKQAESPKRLPKIKEPPASYPRRVRAHAQSQAVRLYSSFEVAKNNAKDYEPDLSPALSDCSSDIFRFLEDPGLEETAPVKTKIEKRMERAMAPKMSHYERQNDMSFGMVHYEDSSIVEAHSQRNLLNQFRGCVRSLLD